MWHYAGAYETGTGHHKLGLLCQDYCICDEVITAGGSRALVVVVSDGAGSASRGEVGSLAICHTMQACAKQFLTRPHSADDITHALVRAWAQQTLKVIVSKAEAMGLTPRDLSATCLGMVVWPDRTLCWQLGDGAMVVDAGESTVEVCVWPQRGEYANETDFLTDDDAIDRIETRIIERPINSVAAFTDGIQSVVLHYATRTANPGFFLPYFATMRTTPPGRHASVDRAIATLISHPSILDRTEDDRTLVLAVRVPPISHATPLAEPELGVPVPPPTTPG